MKKNITTSF